MSILVSLTAPLLIIAFLGLTFANESKPQSQLDIQMLIKIHNKLFFHKKIISMLILTLRKTYMCAKNLQKTLTFRAFKYLLGSIASFFIFGAAVDQYFGPFWPTEPYIAFHDTVDASSFVLPFKITNRSILFSIPRLNVICGVNLFYFIDSEGKIGTLRDASFDPGPISIARNSLTNYPCTGSDYIKVRDDGSLVFGFPDGQSMTTPQGAFRSPLRVIKMCLWISGSYEIFGVPIQFSSTMFQWPAAPNQRQWVEGPVIPDLPNEAWIPKDSRIGGVWALRRMMTPDKKDFLPNALRCDQI